MSEPRNTFALSEWQISILRGKVCPYCKAATLYVDSAVIYGKSFGMIYLCKPCDAYCGVHKGTDKALGRLADAELRYWKKEAHKHFDAIWKEGYRERGKLYEQLANHLNIPIEYCHIGMFSIGTCKMVVGWSKRILDAIRRLEGMLSQPCERS